MRRKTQDQPVHPGMAPCGEKGGAHRKHGVNRMCTAIPCASHVLALSVLCHFQQSLKYCWVIHGALQIAYSQASGLKKPPMAHEPQLGCFYYMAIGGGGVSLFVKPQMHHKNHILQEKKIVINSHSTYSSSNFNTIPQLLCEFLK